MVGEGVGKGVAEEWPVMLLKLQVGGAHTFIRCFKQEWHTKK